MLRTDPGRVWTPRPPRQTDPAAGMGAVVAPSAGGLCAARGTRHVRAAAPRRAARPPAPRPARRRPRAAPPQGERRAVCVLGWGLRCES